MHRSGTSLLGSLLPACGIAMPGPLIPGDSHNPEGYFERTDVTALQEQLLIDLERWWPSPRGHQPLPEGWLQSATGQHALVSLIALLKPELTHQQGPWAIKDPRSSLLLPLWEAACEQLGLPLRLLLAVRDPAEVTVSLVRRDQAYTGMDACRAQRLWWHHNTEVLHHSHHLPVQVVSYSHWFDPQKADQQVRQLAPTLLPAQRLEALQAVKPQHRRSRHTASTAEIHPALQQLYERLHHAALDPTSTASLIQWVEQQPTPLAQPQQTNHPWCSFAEFRGGSDPAAVEQRIQHWQRHGFSNEELSHATALPFTAPCASPQQLREPSETNSNVVNEADIEAGPSGAALLLLLAKQPQVFDRNRARVGLLRQFGVPAFWLPT